MKLQMQFNMLNNKLLYSNIQQYINANLEVDLQKLALKGSLFDGIETAELIEQIQSKLKCKKKLPSWFNTSKIYYPGKVSIEQTSSEITADFKSQLVFGKSLIDLTGGFGVDSFYFSKHINHVVHCEINETLSDIVKHNFEVLNQNNIECIKGDGLELLTQNNEQYDWIYLDPSRRNEQRQKRVFVEDCTPDVSKHLEALFQFSDNILVKMSPMLDIQAGLNVMQPTRAVYVVAVNNEVKELLFVLKKGYSADPKIQAVNLNTNQASFEFLIRDEQDMSPKFNPPLKYLYEPNAAVLKAGGFKSIAQVFGVSKLDQHTHLYTSNRLIQSFPGKVYRVSDVLPYQKKLLKRRFSGLNANVKIRHFPMSVEQIKKDFNINDGGNLFLIFCIFNKQKNVIISERIRIQNE